VAPMDTAQHEPTGLTWHQAASLTVERMFCDFNRTFISRNMTLWTIMSLSNWQRINPEDYASTVPREQREARAQGKTYMIVTALETKGL